MDVATCPHCGQSDFDIEIVLTNGSRGSNAKASTIAMHIEEYRSLVMHMGIVRRARVLCHSCGYMAIDFERGVSPMIPGTMLYAN